MESVYRLFSDSKYFLSNELNRVFVAVIIIGCLTTFLNYRQQLIIVKSNQELLSAIQETEKKVDFRYFNLTRSLEDIHETEIDTKDGSTKPIRRIKIHQ